MKPGLFRYKLFMAFNPERLIPRETAQPGSKQITMTKCQNHKHVWALDIAIWNLFVFWCLYFGIWHYFKPAGTP
jgi:hypothetical protein